MKIIFFYPVKNLLLTFTESPQEFWILNLSFKTYFSGDFAPQGVCSIWQNIWGQVMEVAHKIKIKWSGNMEK